jgi:hypothetical protein
MIVYNIQNYRFLDLVRGPMFWKTRITGINNEILRICIIWIKKKSIWALCTSIDMKGVSGKLKIIGNWCNIRKIFKTKHTLRRYSASVAFAVNVAQATLTKRVDLYMCVSVNIGTISEMFFLGKSKLAQYVNGEEHMVIWNEARILWSENNSRYKKYNRFLWQDEPIWSVNSVWLFFPSRAPFSVMRLATHKEGQYELMNSSCISTRF